MKPDKTELHEKFIDKVSDGTIFYKQPFLPTEIKYIFDCVDVVDRVKKRKAELELFLKQLKEIREKPDHMLAPIAGVLEQDELDEINRFLGIEEE